MQELIVTLDGPAGSGKSTVARRLARRLGLDFLDTGAMYRAVAAACLDRGIDTATDLVAVSDLAGKIKLRFDWGSDPPRLFSKSDCGEQDVTDRLRDSDVTAGASQVAAIADVRNVLVDTQRQIGTDHQRLVSEGRDQGSIVFPHAQVRFYLDATPQVRAARRAKQLREAGKDADDRQVLDAIQQRDHRDSHRAAGPLICPDGAIRIDTSELTIDEVVDLLERHVRQRTARKSGRAGSSP